MSNSYRGRHRKPEPARAALTQAALSLSDCVCQIRWPHRHRIRAAVRPAPSLTTWARAAATLLVGAVAVGLYVLGVDTPAAVPARAGTPTPSGASWTPQPAPPLPSALDVFAGSTVRSQPHISTSPTRSTTSPSATHSTR